MSEAPRDTGDATMQAMVTYTVVISPGEDGWFLAQVPEVPEAISQGRSVEEARSNVSEALSLALEWRAEEGEKLLEPGAVTVSQVTVGQP